MSLAELGHMAVGNKWHSTGLARGVPNLLKEAMATEPTLPYIHKGRTATEVIWAGKFNLQIEKDLTALAEAAVRSEPASRKVVIPTMLAGELKPRSPLSVVPKDKYQLAKQMVENQYKASYQEKPWAYMWCYYCDEDRARLSGGIGYVGHHGGGDLNNMGYDEYVETVMYPLVFAMSAVFVICLITGYYIMFGTFASGLKGRYD
eukprot:NODE_3277_length_1009_cov_32.713542_g3014_i0.p1 GENE.NODE_3277_length_1009_cov_32.713542_g3014_i0~~NODE_3277_length_1009_cov_32.713542_g3014_i0.p1  ORF type:complete len:204 (+),score=45.88 NODE_3277_length_1009_cov_32.713542_g3014_i0:77-688(+)